MYFRLMGKLNARRKGLQNESEKGFTLIELLVVVIIIGILAAIAIPVYIGIQNNAKDSAVKSDLNNIKTAEVSYFTTNGSYATDLTKLSGSGYSGGSTDYTKTGAVAPAITVSGTGDASTFCVTATSPTTKAFHVSDTSGVADGAACK